MKIGEFLRKYPAIELYGREQSNLLYQLITEQDRNQSPLAYLIALGIPASSALTLAAKISSDACRAIDTIIQTLNQREYAGGNVQTLAVDAAEYGRSMVGLLGGALVALYSPGYAAEKFLTITADPAIAFLTLDEGARLYAMADRLHDFLLRHNIDYRICSGTALGAIREQGIIRNDDDVDLMLHPDSIDKFKQLLENGTFTRETGISIEPQDVTGGWQCFYSDSPKGEPNTPTEHIGKPFVDIFPGIRRFLNGKEIITYGEEKMYLQSKGDHFSPEEWGEPTLYTFGPTKLFGVEPNAMKNYLSRCYGPSALHYKTRLFPHEVYSQVYANPLRAFSILSRHPLPRYMRHVAPAPLDFDRDVYAAQLALANAPALIDVTPNPEEIRIWVDGIFDLFHQGHINVLKNSIEYTRKKYPAHTIKLLVGVCGDGDDVKQYKRQPVMTLAERCQAVDLFMKELGNYPNTSYQIIPNSPVTHDLAFIMKHRLNILFHGSDFTPEKIRKHYGVILEQCAGTCAFEILPYTKGISTTELIQCLLNDGDLGDTPNTTGIAVEVLADRVRQRSDEFYTPSVRVG